MAPTTHTSSPTAPARHLDPARRPGRMRSTGGPLRLLGTVRTLAAAIAMAMVVMTAGRPPGASLTTVTTALQRRLARLRHGQAARDAGLTTVEVAIITAVLLGLATALVAAITIVVNRNTSKIT
jgi:hypothetical protein